MMAKTKRYHNTKETIAASAWGLDKSHVGMLLVSIYMNK